MYIYTLFPTFPCVRGSKFRELYIFLKNKYFITKLHDLVYNSDTRNMV